jgi:hypothetical protein
MRATILRHRDIVRISIGRIPMGPNALEHSERLLAVMRGGGLPDRLAVTGQHLLFAVVNGFTLDETVDLGVGDAAPVDEQSALQARDFIAALPADRFPNLVAVADHFAFADSDARFALLIDLYVDGLAQRVRLATPAEACKDSVE